MTKKQKKTKNGSSNPLKPGVYLMDRMVLIIANLENSLKRKKYDKK